jgi:hypothetical protein
MVGRISGFIREYIFGLSIITLIIGLIMIFMGVLWFGFNEFVIDTIELDLVFRLGEWNAYVFVIGWILFAIGVFYLYTFLKNRKYVLEEIRTDKRSDFIKKHGKLKIVSKNLPTKYQQMLEEKEKELGIK